tara:strand:+ start:759 stop:1499 length:741 start_codon:yes stop_codon:yes gene_type:complete
MASLGVNIDHIANIRQARQTDEPNPTTLALLAEIGGADGITAHLREDRRHIQDKDLDLLRATIHSRLNLEIAPTNEMIQIALKIRPDMVTLVPEKREEITTEGGLAVTAQERNLSQAIEKLKSSGIPVSLFVDPIKEELQATKRIGSTWVELHTGNYANADWKSMPKELAKIQEGTYFARSIGLRVNSGHGLTYNNVEPIASIQGMEELNIGHTIVSRAVAVGLTEAVKEMKSLILNPRKDLLFES